MTDLDVRVLQVRLLNDMQIFGLHEREINRGARLSPAEIQEAYVKRMLKAAYDVPAKGSKRMRMLREWSDRVRQVIARFARERGGPPSLEDLPALHAFDDAVRASDIDLHYRTATVAKRASGLFE